MRILVTGGAGFIGSALVRRLIEQTAHEVLVFDKLTYAGLLSSLESASTSNRYGFVQGDICDAEAVRAAITDFRPQVIAHLAAESHVDRSIDGPGEFVQTNVVGTFTMLQQALGYWRGLEGEEKSSFRFHHISTDEVFGSLGETGLFTETTPYDPRSPYSASKAASDHLVSAWGHTYGLPVLMTNCSNNYGPYHFPEKLIPLIIIRALNGEPLPVYGDGSNIRDWIHVEDHAEALCLAALHAGKPGGTYCIGPRQERTNLQVVKAICAVLDRLRPDPAGPRERLITFVKDRPGHDFRYAMDPSGAEAVLGWTAKYDFESGLDHTLRWYLDHEAWWGPIRARRYAGQRLGAAQKA